MASSPENRRIRRDRAGRYVTSGNPGGRPREWWEFRDLARRVGAPVAFEVLLAAMQGKHPLARVRAALAMLAYAYGYPAQVQAGYEMPGVPPGVARKMGEPPRGTFELKLIVEDTPATMEGPEPRPDLPPSITLPDGGGEDSEDSDSLPPSSGVPPAEA